MHRAETTAEPARPVENELLVKLDKSLRERAEKMVDAALKPAINKAIGVIEDAMCEGLGIAIGAVGPSIRSEVGVYAAKKIRDRAVELAYRKLVDQTLAQLTGTPVKEG